MSQVDPERCREVAVVIKSLAHTERLMILCFLSEKECHVNELAELTGISQSAVSQFVNKMKMQGVLSSKRYGRQVSYFISDERIKRLMTALHEIYGP